MSEPAEQIDVAILKNDISYLKRDVNEIKTVLLADVKSQIREVKELLDNASVKWQELGGLTKGLVDLQVQLNSHVREYHTTQKEMKDELDSIRNRIWWFAGIGSALVAIPLIGEILNILHK